MGVGGVETEEGMGTAGEEAVTLLSTKLKLSSRLQYERFACRGGERVSLEDIVTGSKCTR